MGETYYEVLEVDPDATRDEIESAYRDRVLETHPDHSDDPDAAEQFKRVSTARSVLTDGDERARYDRLGHEAYVSLGERTGNASSDARSSTTDSGGSNAGSSGSAGATTSSAGASSERRRSNSTGPGSERRTGRTWTGSSSDTDSDGDDRGRSHHARQRKRRRRKRAQRRAAGQWPFGREPGTGGESAEQAGTTADTAGTVTGGTASDADPSGSSVRYVVHGWDDEIDLEWDSQSLDQSTAVTISCIWLLYPILVASSLTAAFPAPVNVIVAACTIAIVGYLLTRPRIAIALFGFWSLVFPLGMLRTDVSPVSVIGLVALGFVWVPFGYAVGLWWALRP